MTLFRKSLLLLRTLRKGWNGQWFSSRKVNGYLVIVSWSKIERYLVVNGVYPHRKAITEESKAEGRYVFGLYEPVSCFQTSHVPDGYFTLPAHAHNVYFI